jgi:hypothetical protein
MPIKAYLLKPNLTAIGTSFGTPITGSLAAGSTGSTVNLAAPGSGALSSVLPLTTGPFGAIRTDWLYITNGTYSGYHWRITNLAVNGGDGTGVCTIDGTVPADLGTPTYEIKSAVDARCAWTTETTVTYFECLFNTYADQSKNEINITSAANRIKVIVNLKKYNGTAAFGTYKIGNKEDLVPGHATLTTAGQLRRFWDYAGLYWQSVSPKYCRLFKYVYPTGKEYTGDYKYYSATYAQERVVPNMPAFEEDSYNNVTIKQLPLELL